MLIINKKNNKFKIQNISAPTPALPLKGEGVESGAALPLKGEGVESGAAISKGRGSRMGCSHPPKGEVVVQIIPPLEGEEARL